MKHLIALCVLIFSALFSGAAESGQWEQVCPGGGGRFLYPAFDPSEPGTLFCASDMGPCYRSEDRGYNWKTYPSNELQITGTGNNSRGSWAGDPHRPGVIWAGSGYGLVRSPDHGKSWEPVAGPWLPGKDSRHTGPQLIAFSRKTPGRIALSFDRFQHKPEMKICISDDNGKSWTVSSPPIPRGSWNHSSIRSILFDPEDDNTLLVFGAKSVLRSRDNGKTWEEIGKGLPLKEENQAIYDATGSFDGTRRVLYATTKSVAPKDGTVTPGVFRSDDGGENWTPVAGNGLPRRIVKGQWPEYELIQAAADNPDRVYVTLRGRSNVLKEFDDKEHANVFRSDDGGKNWTPLLFTNTNQKNYNVANAVWTSDLWGWAGRPTGLAVDPADSNRVLAIVNGLYLSEDAGKSWRALHTGPMEKNGQRGGGMPIMTSWVYNFDPHDKTRHYLSMTDYCGFMSVDAGRTWRNILDAESIRKQEPAYPWLSNIYNMAFDPKTPGRVWLAAADMHDIPFYTYREKMHRGGGGVVVSDDAGKTFRIAARDKSLPNAAMLDILLLPGENGAPDTLFAAAMGKGIYASTDGGKTWAERNTGLAENNRSILRLRNDGHGKLYALATINMQNPDQPVGGAVYVSEDRGNRWRMVFSDQAAPYPVNLTVSPHNPQELLLSVFDRNWQDKSGGLWASYDGGKNWAKILNGCIWNATYSPTVPGRIYVATMGDGLKVSDDGGKNWWSETSFPYWRPTGIYFDPSDPDILYVTSFGGGVFKGRESLIHPRAVLRNKAMKAEIYLPDARRGFYRSTRFDWSGMIGGVTTAKHRYFGNFREPHDPLLDDSASGPAEEFGLEDPPGYADAKVGDTFLKIGVGHLERINDRFYWARRKFPIADGGVWRTTQPDDRQIRFEHRLPVRRGYGYAYEKTVSVHPEEPLLEIRHELRNTGEKEISTNVYAHNFLMMDGRKIGPEYTVEFPFSVEFAGDAGLRRPAVIRGRQLHLTENLISEDTRPLYSKLAGFENSGAAANDFTVKNSSTGAEVRITGDQPLRMLEVYGQERALCVEPFTAIRLKPGESAVWQTSYRFR